MPRLTLLQKLLLVLVVIVVFFVAIGVLITANRGSQVEGDQVQTLPQNPNSGLLTNPDFETTQSLELVQSGTLHPFSPLLFVGEQLAYQNQNRELVFNDTVLPAAPRRPLNEIYSLGDGGFLFDTLSGPVWVNNRGQEQALPSTLLSVAPYADGYRYLRTSTNGSGFEIGQTSILDSDFDEPSLASIRSTNDFLQGEIRTLAETTYVFFYDAGYETIEVWQFQNDQVRKVRDLEGVSSFKIFEDFVLFTDPLEVPSDLTDYQVNWLNLENPEQLFLQTFNWTRALGQNQIYGDPSAYRCDFDGRDTLYCLVKQADVPDFFIDYKDVLFTYNLETNRLEYPYAGLDFAASRVYVSPAKEVYLNLQDSRQLYKFSQ